MERIKFIGRLFLYFGISNELWYITGPSQTKTYHFIHLGMHEFSCTRSDGVIRKADVLCLTIFFVSMKIGILRKEK